MNSTHKKILGFLVAACLTGAIPGFLASRYLSSLPIV